MKLQTLVCLSFISFSTGQSNASAIDSKIHSKNHHYERVVVCRRDFSPINFCDHRHLNIINKVLARQMPNFAGHYIFFTADEVVGKKGVVYRKSAAIVDAKTGVVYPLPFTYFGGHVDRKGFELGEDGGRASFGLATTKICISGSLYDYQNVLTNTEVCFLFNERKFERCTDGLNCKKSYELQ